MKSRVDWRAVFSNDARMPLGFIVRSTVMVDVLDAELGEIVRVSVPCIRVRRRSDDKPWF